MDRRSKDLMVSRLMRLASLFSILLVLGMGFVLCEQSIPILVSQPLRTLLTSSLWNPANGEFGLYGFIVGTFVVTGLTLLMACPICVLTAIYLAEYAPRNVRRIVKPAVDLLAGIPSVVFGLWGILFVIPLIRNYLSEWMGVSTTGYSILAGAVVLSIMISPILISISEEVIRAVPFRLREASMALGATKWQTTKSVVVRRALPGVLAAVVLAFGRAFGETMAVLMVVGNVAKIPSSILDPAYPLPALIANDYGEMLSIPLYGSVLMFAALILFVVIAVFSILARLVLAKVEGWTY